MLKWQIYDSCGNSPKNQMLIDWVQAFIEQKRPHLFIDEESLFIYNEESEPLSTVNPPEDIEEIVLEKAITHGRVGAILGKAVANQQTYPFSLFFEFSLGKQPKIKEVQCIVNLLNI